MEAALKRAPKRPPKAPKIDPKTTPRRPPEDQKCPSEQVLEFCFKCKPNLDDFRPQNGVPNGTQNRSKIDLGAQGPPRSLPEPSRVPFWPHFGPPGGSFSSLLGALFEDCARPATRSNAQFEITGQKDFRDRCRPDVLEDAGSVAGLGAPAPLEIRPLSLSGSSLAVERSERRHPETGSEFKPNVYRR